MATSVLTIFRSVYYTRSNSTNGTDSTGDICAVTRSNQKSDVICEGNLTDCANRVERTVTEWQTNVLCDGEYQTYIPCRMDGI